MRFITVGTLLLAALPQLQGADAARTHRISPQFILGPKADPVEVPGALFSCQLPTARVGCYTPSQILAAYNIQPLLDQGSTGAGKTIVIIDAFQSPTLLQDLQVFISTFGVPGINLPGGPVNPALPTFTQIAPDGLTPFDPNNADEVGWSGEISLDVEWAHAIAPGANIVLVLAKSDQDSDILSATKYAIDNRLGDVISQSFGELETCMDPGLATQQHQLFIEATLKSMTILASSGDNGAAQPSCDGNSLVKGVSTPAVDPLVVGVGGTKLSAALDGTYQGETVWNDQYGASGGGYSVLYYRPIYQSSSQLQFSRGVPDVAYNGDVNGGVLTAWSQGDPAQVGSIYIFGGTSAGSPQWAALIAITDQRAGYALGFISNALYLIANDLSLRDASYHDITTGNNSFNGIIGYNAGPGWDPTTGLGTPNAFGLLDRLIAFTSPLDGIIAISEMDSVSSGAASALAAPTVHAGGRVNPH